MSGKTLSGEVLKIGECRQLFVDDFIVAQMCGVSRTLNQPTKYAGNPIMIPLYPWEGRIELYGTVLRDPDEGLLRMWYMGMGNMGMSC